MNKKELLMTFILAVFVTGGSWLYKRPAPGFVFVNSGRDIVQDTIFGLPLNYGRYNYLGGELKINYLNLFFDFLFWFLVLAGSRWSLRKMKKLFSTRQAGFSAVELLIILTILIVAAVGGMVVLPAGRQVWQNKISPTPKPILYPVPSPVPTSILTPQPIEQLKTISCQNDADCPILDCIQDCPAEGPCPPCSQYKCINGLCQRVYSYYSESLGKKIQLFPGQTVSLTGASLSLTLLQIIPAPEGSFDYPTKAEIEVRSGTSSEKISFTAGVLTTREVEAKLRVREVFGFRITRVELRQEWIILTVEKL